MKIKKRYILLILIILFFIKQWYDKYSLDCDKKEIIASIENYKMINHKFPADLSILNLNLTNNFYYKSDSLKQSFKLSYLFGFMDSNCFFFESSKGFWQNEYTE